jgi:hypothetical protein
MSSSNDHEEQTFRQAVSALLDSAGIILQLSNGEQVAWLDASSSDPVPNPASHLADLLSDCAIVYMNIKQFMESRGSAQGVIGGHLKEMGGFLWRALRLVSLLDQIVEKVRSRPRYLGTNRRVAVRRARNVGMLADKYYALKAGWEHMIRRWFPDFVPQGFDDIPFIDDAENEPIIADDDGKVTLAQADKGSWTIDVSPPNDPSVSLRDLMNSVMRYEVSEPEDSGKVTLTAHSILPPTLEGSGGFPGGSSTGEKSTSVGDNGKTKVAFSVETSNPDFADTLRSLSTKPASGISNLHVNGHSGPTSLRQNK